MKVSTMKVRINGITPIIGGVPMDKELFTKFVASKANSEKKVKSLKNDELVESGKTEREFADEDVNLVQDMLDERSITGFYRDPKTNNLIIRDYQVKGFLKSAAKALKDQLKLVSYLSKMDNFVFIVERNIPIMRDGEWIKDPDGYIERPLRAETMQGSRVALAKSEMVEEGWYAEFTIKVVENNGTAKSVAIDLDLIKDLLSYGELKGMLQWRNGGNGSFTYEVIG